MSEREFADALREWWSFSSEQQHTHSWHDREKFIQLVLPKFLAKRDAALRAQVERLEGEKLRLRSCAVELNEYINVSSFPVPIGFVSKLAAVLRETEVDNNQGEKR